MSSNAEHASRLFAPVCGPVWLFAVSLGVASPVAAQSGEDVTSEAQDTDEEVLAEEAPAPRGQFDGVDLSITVPKDPSDELLEEDCEEEADAGRISNEIVVCRQLGEATDGSFNKEEWEKKYAERTAFKGAPGTPNTFGIANHGNAIGFGKVPPPALLIDVEALPQAPEGSDADRIARGLPPLGQDELTPEEIAERRRKLGLEAPDLPSDPE